MGRTGVMALSEDEQQLLDDMERSLIRNAPTFVANLAFRHVRRHLAALKFAVFVLGIIMLMAGLVETSLSVLPGVIISVAGVLMMTAALVTIPRHWRSTNRP